MPHPDFSGVISPILTPFNDDYSIAMDLYLDHARWSLDQGAHFLSPFGTTGEAVNVGLQERKDTLEHLVQNGIDPSALMPGTGVCALADTADLCRHALELGCAGVMVLPPFYYPTSEEGLFRYYANLIETVGSDALRICLYHIPQMSGVTLSPALTARLNAAFPNIVVAYKDSAGKFEHTHAVIKAAPDVSVFPASENHLEMGLPLGAAGCISATVNSQPALVRAMYDALRADDQLAVSTRRDQMEAHRNAVQSAGFIPALKSMFAAATGDARWQNIRPPMENAPDKLGHDLISKLGWSRAISARTA